MSDERPSSWRIKTQTVVRLLVMALLLISVSSENCFQKSISKLLDRDQGIQQSCENIM